MSRCIAAALAGLLLLGACSDDGGYRVVGTVERDRIALTAERAEPLTAIHVREGDRVEAGAPVATLDDRRAVAERERLAARRDRTQRRLDELLRGPRREAIAEARARLAGAESAVGQAQREVERARRLRVDDLSSEQELDAARTRLETARSERDAARAALEALVEGTTVEELDQARARVAEAEAALRRQTVEVERLTLASPRAGRVEALPFEVGETPAPGSPVAVLRAVDQPPHARVYVPAGLRERLRFGSEVTLHVDGHGAFGGRVRFVASEAAFTPYFALTEHDAGRLSYLAEIDVLDGADLPTGVPVRLVAASWSD